MRGITKSSSTKSTFSWPSSSSASWPSCAGSAANALASKMEHTTLRIVGLSSTTRIRALISEGPSIVPVGRPLGQGQRPEPWYTEMDGWVGGTGGGCLLGFLRDRLWGKRQRRHLEQPAY